MSKYAGLSFGSLAYDPFSTSAPEIEFPPEATENETEAYSAEEYALRQEAFYHAREQVLPPEELREEARTRAFRRILAAVGVPVAAVCIVLLVMILQSYMELTAISDETAQLESTIDRLRDENSRLEIMAESVFNMEEVEDTAESVIGMVKVNSDQMAYLRSTTEDMAVIMDQPERTTLLDRSAALIRRFLALFRR